MLCRDAASVAATIDGSSGMGLVVFCCFHLATPRSGAIDDPISPGLGLMGDLTCAALVAAVSALDGDFGGGDF